MVKAFNVQCYFYSIINACYNTLLDSKIASSVAFELCYKNVHTKPSLNCFNLKVF